MANLKEKYKRCEISDLHSDSVNSVPVITSLPEILLCPLPDIIFPSTLTPQVKERVEVGQTVEDSVKEGFGDQQQLVFSQLFSNEFLLVGS